MIHTIKKLFGSKKLSFNEQIEENRRVRDAHADRKNKGLPFRSESKKFETPSEFLFVRQ